MDETVFLGLYHVWKTRRTINKKKGVINMSYSIGKDFRFFSLLKFAFPTIIMMMFMSLYSIIDGIFIAQYVGTNALSAANIAFPAFSVLIAIGVMLATGGSAVVTTKLGEDRNQEARENFSFLTLVGIVLGIFVILIGNVWIEPIVRALGATDLLLSYSISYLRIILCFAPATILQALYQSFFVAAGKPGIGLAVTILGGLFNIVFDYVFIVPMNMGISGAALATVLGQMIPALAGLVYFSVSKGILHYVKPKLSLAVLRESCFNGSSEMVTNVSNAVITYLFNIYMLKFLGEDGVAAITIVLYGQFLFNAMYMGFSMGVAPVFSYNHGSGNQKLLKRIFKICIRFIGGSAVCITILAVLSAPYVVKVFAPEGTPTYSIALRGFVLFSFNYLFAGFNIFSSALFTAFSNGKISAAISFLRTFVFIVASILILSSILLVDGIWLSVPLAELLTIFISAALVWKKRKAYGYA